MSDYIPEEGRSVFECPMKVAARKDPDLAVFVADDYVLMLDLDSPEEEAEFSRRSGMVIEMHDAIDAPVPWVGPMLKTVSRSGKGSHVYLRLRRQMPVFERIALQGALGSDSKRNLLSYLAASFNGAGLEPPEHRRPPIVLFETPEGAQRVRAWLDLWALESQMMESAPQPKQIEMREDGGFLSPGYRVGQTDVIVLDE